VLFPVVLLVEVAIADLASRKALGYKIGPLSYLARALLNNAQSVGAPIGSLRFNIIQAALRNVVSVNVNLQGAILSSTREPPSL